MKKNAFLYIGLFVLLFLFVPRHIQAEKRLFTVVIDAGHGGKDPGAVGSSSKEKDINLAVALKLGRMMSDRNDDVKVVYTRDKDRFVELNDRANIANKHKADLFISIHTNAVGRATVRGTETYTLGLARSDENLQVAMRENAAILLEDDYIQKYEGFDPKSTESYIIFEFMQNKYMEQSVSFASDIQKGFVGCKRSDRGVRQAGFLVLRKTSMPSVLVELGYISNRDEERYMKSTEGQNQLAKAIYDAFVKYKKEHDRKQGVPISVVSVVAKEKEKEVRPQVVSENKDQVVYKVQILVSNKKLAPKARELKGYSDAQYYVENGMYKYTYGETTSMAEIKRIQKKLLGDFKDAFIVSFKNGEKVK